MERLTDKHFSGKGYYMLCSGVLRCDGNCGECEELEKVVDRLGEYEDEAEQKRKTNADRIRAMSDEELAKFIPDWSYTNACKCDEQPYVDCNNECEKCVLEWLQQPAEGE